MEAVIKNFSPLTGSETEWNAAYQRLEHYLRALRIENKVQQNQIILHWLESAARAHAGQSDQSPTTLAMAEARVAMEGWFGMIVRRGDPTDAALVSILATHSPEKWLANFPTEDISDDLRQALRENNVRAGPDLQLSSMVPGPIVLNPLPDRTRLLDLWGKLAEIWRSLLWPS